MTTFITNLISQKILLGVFLCAVLFLTPLSFSYTENNNFALQNIESQTLIVSAQSSPAPTAEKKTASSPTQIIMERAGEGFWNSVGLWVGNQILATASMLTYLGGKSLDISLSYTVFGMGDLIKSGGLGVAINGAWVLIRDICNLAFIFGFVYVGIRTIIDPESASTKRFLSKIIIGALLINFSLFFVKFIVDFANFTAYHIYTAMIIGSGTLSATIADMLGIVTLFSSPDPARFAEITGGGLLWYFIFGAILLLVVAFIFFAAAIQLVIRFVALVFIMIGSPILFGATVFPQTEHYASDLWKKLISYAFFAPVFLLLLLISITMMQSLGTAISPVGDTFAKAIRSGGGNEIGQMGIVLKFIIIIFFFVQSLLIAQKMGIAGGDAAVSMGNKLRTQGQRYLGNATFGAAAGLSRATVGNLAHHISEKDNLKEAASRRGLRGVAARQALKASRVVGDASFDARNVNGLGNAIGAGEGRKGGYKTVLEEVEKKEKEFATSLGEVGDDDVRVEARKKETESGEKSLKQLNEGLSESQDQRRSLLKQINDTKRSGGDTTALDDQLKTIDLTITQQKASVEEQEKNNKESKLLYESEKQRRIIGSTFANETRNDATKLKVENFERAIDARKKTIKSMWATYTKLPEGPDKIEAREAIEKFNTELDKLKKEQRVFLNKQGDQGYASVLESSKIHTAWPIGRLVTQEREAGKAIRKSAEKGLPKKKDD